MQNAALAALGLDAVYVALRTCPDTLELVVRGVLASGGALNVTVPHKRAVVVLLDEASPVVRRTGACNVVWGGPRGITGDNTDVGAVRTEAARLLAGRPVRRALVLGTGGSARAAAVAIADGWAGATVDVLSRDARRAAEFRAWASSAGVRVEAAGEGPMDLVVNATPLGLSAADPLPLDLAQLRALGPAAVLDLVYVRGGTRLVRGAREAGIVSEDGRGVLVEQGAASLRLFFDVQPPREVMRAAVEDALGA
jgi:shikimate dehydrogenase